MKCVDAIMLNTRTPTRAHYFCSKNKKPSGDIGNASDACVPEVRCRMQQGPGYLPGGGERTVAAMEFVNICHL